MAATPDRASPPAAQPAVERPSRWTRFLMSIMGPPQLGDASAPIRPSRPDLDVCTKCGLPMVEHEPVRTSRATFLRCPSDTPSR